MKAIFRILVISLFASSAVFAADISLSRTFPELPVELPPKIRLHVAINYDVNVPSLIQVSAMRGDDVVGMSSGGKYYAAGQGEAYAWVALREPGSITQLRVTVFDAEQRKKRTTTLIPIELGFSSSAPLPSKPPQWVDELRAQVEATDEAIRAAQPRDEGSSFIADFFLLIVFGFVLVPAAVSAYGFLKWERPWKYYISAPLGVLLAWIAWLLVSLAMDPTSHNLWPFELAIGAAAAWPYLVVVIGWRWWAMKNSHS